jgi:hypothetical protein
VTERWRVDRFFLYIYIYIYGGWISSDKEMEN